MILEALHEVKTNKHLTFSRYSHCSHGRIIGGRRLVHLNCHGAIAVEGDDDVTRDERRAPARSLRVELCEDDRDHLLLCEHPAGKRGGGWRQERRQG